MYMEFNTLDRCFTTYVVVLLFRVTRSLLKVCQHRHHLLRTRQHSENCTVQNTAAKVTELIMIMSTKRRQDNVFDPIP